MSVEDLKARLRALNLDEMEAQALADVRSGKKTKRDAGIKILRAVQGIKRSGVAPEDLIVTKVPVIPAGFRPYTVEGETFLPGDANELYADLIKAKEVHQEVSDELGPEHTKEARDYLRKAVRAAYGYDDSPNVKIRTRRVSGLFQKIVANNPKQSWVQGKLLSKPQDQVGRAVISPDPSLGMDQLKIPEDMAWEISNDVLEGALASQGVSKLRRLQMIKERHPVARTTLVKLMETNPVVYSRAPAWHRQSVISGYASMSEGNNIRISPLVTAGIAGDFNGDQQIGKVLVLCHKDSLCHNLLRVLQCQCSSDFITAMKNSKMLPTFDTGNMRLHLCDLEDLPRGGKLGENPLGKNGKIDFFKAPEGMLAVSFSDRDGGLVWADVAAISVHHDRLIEVVDLTNGRQIITDDDPRAIFGMDPATGDMARATPSEANARRLVIPCVKDLAKACVGLGSLGHVEIEDRKIELDFDFGYLLGALVGDGWWDKRDYSGRKGVYLSDLGGHNARKVEGVLCKLFGPVSCSSKEFNKSDSPGRYGDTVKYTYHSKSLKAFCDFCDLWLGGSKTDTSAGSGSKKIPDFFLLAPHDFRRGVLTGLFDTDGTCGISNAKGRPQLMCAITTTSVRLASDIKFLCLTLGVHASVSFSKKTSRGNTSWMCAISTPDLKRHNLLSGLQTPHKLTNFVKTDVSELNTSLVHDKAVVPDAVFSLVNFDLFAPKITAEHRKLLPPSDLAYKKKQQNIYQQWHKSGKDKVISRHGAREVVECLELLIKEREGSVAEAIRILETENTTLSNADYDALVAGIKALAPPRDIQASPRVAAAYSSIRTSKYRGILTAATNSRLRHLLSTEPVYTGALKNPEVINWIATILENSEITWSTIKEIHRPGVRETGYDLTVPGYETFMSADGVILSNTMAVHLPVLPEAIKDAKEKLLPSRMLFSIRDRDKTLPTPKHESLLGLFSSQQAPMRDPVRVSSPDEALKMYESGKLGLDDHVEYD